MSRQQHTSAWTAIVLFIFLFGIPKIFHLFGDFLWFGSLGFQEIFTTILSTKIAIFVAAFGLAGIIFFVNYAICVAILKKTIKKYNPKPIAIYVILGVSFLFGISHSASWQTVLEFLHAVSFGSTEPIFGLDIGFYVFQLPFYELLIRFLLLTLVASIVLMLIVYILSYGIGKENRMMDTTVIEVEAFNVVKGLQNVKKHALGHFSILASLFFFLYGVSVYLSRFEMLYDSSGAVYGAGYVDASITIPLLFVISILSFLGGILAFANAWIHKHRILFGIVMVIFGLLIIQTVASGVMQRFVVQPDEFNKEQQYLKYNIDLTRQAYNLNKISEEEFPLSDSLTTESLAKNPETLRNVRLWDYRPLKTTYNQIQIFRSYYNFHDVDIDRYSLGNRTEVVMLSAREIDVSSLPQQSRTWVNEHLVYTHGYGLAMSPVSQISKQGLPNLYVKDIPPTSTVDLEVENAQIYFGEKTDAFAIVNTGTKELDYPSGDENVYSTYTGTAGIKLDTFTKKATFAMMFGDINLLISDSLTKESRILLRRQISERLHTLAPFLQYDRDPYLVVANKRLYWIYDAYTTSNRFPYSEPVRFGRQSINYIRNSVKAVIDAQNGDVTFYVADVTDPILSVYSSVFPKMFVPLTEMNEELAKHIRYPEDIFTVQAAVYRDYHMQDPRVFYNKEDRWRIPEEVLRGRKITMEPYYIIMKLPGQDREEFIQVLPFIPVGRENMIAWIAARSDLPHYGELQTYLFSKQSLAFGPMQIESKIDQDPEISERITLWSQSGSDVIRGNLLAIPIENSILYVEPLFLEATSGSSLPELRRVIVAYEDRVVMEPTFEEALDRLFGEGAGSTSSVIKKETSSKKEKSTGIILPKDDRSLIEEAFNRYVEGKKKLTKGDLGGYGDDMDAVGDILEELQKK